MALDPASLPDDVDALKRMIVGMAQDAVHATTLIEKLRFELARLADTLRRAGYRDEEFGFLGRVPGGGVADGWSSAVAG